MSNVRPWHMLKGPENKVSSDISEKRYSICESCPSLKLGICTECGCRMKWKTQLKFASCPLEKWGPEVENSNITIL
jgi:hypothetical protein